MGLLIEIDSTNNCRYIVRTPTTQTTMQSFDLPLDQIPFEQLPPLASSPGYEVLEGSPETAIHFYRGDNDSPTRLGLWRCTPGEFRCIEKGDELQTLIAGRLTLIFEDGSEHHLEPGQSIYTEKGERVIWRIEETVTKIFFTSNP